MSGQSVLQQGSNTVEHNSPVERYEKEAPPSESASHDSDDEPMVYSKPRDYATWARQERDRCIEEGAMPDSVILQSEVGNYIPHREDESPSDYAKRYSKTMNTMIHNGVVILNDLCVADVKPNVFFTADGRYFDLSLGSGVTKREYREFAQWFDKFCDGTETSEVPEKWRAFEKSAPMDT